MALRHAEFMEVIDLLAPEPIGSASVSTSLFKAEQLQVLRLVLPKDHTMPEHSVPGEITIHCLSGNASITTPQSECQLGPGGLVVLPRDEPHAVQAHDATTLLVTIVHA